MGLWRAPGWDTIDEVKANMLGWKTYSFNELHLIHHRFTGTAESLWRDKIKRGVACYVTGYHPLFVAASCVSQSVRRPYLGGSAAIAYGFLKGYWERMPRVNDQATHQVCSRPATAASVRARKRFGNERQLGSVQLICAESAENSTFDRDDSVSARAHSGHAGYHPPPRTRTIRDSISAVASRAWSCPTLDHRSQQRPPATLQRRRHGLDCLQWRNLQLSGAAHFPSAKATSFKTQTDTEVIVHLYEEFGPQCVEKLRGMFAFAIWDENKKTLFLARDRVGIKPLYYSLNGPVASSSLRRSRRSLPTPRSPKSCAGNDRPLSDLPLRSRRRDAAERYSASWRRGITCWLRMAKQKSAILGSSVPQAGGQSEHRGSGKPIIELAGRSGRAAYDCGRSRWRSAERRSGFDGGAQFAAERTTRKSAPSRWAFPTPDLPMRRPYARLAAETFGSRAP